MCKSLSTKRFKLHTALTTWLQGFWMCHQLQAQDNHEPLGLSTCSDRLGCILINPIRGFCFTAHLKPMQ